MNLRRDVLKRVAQIAGLQVAALALTFPCLAWGGEIAVTMRCRHPVMLDYLAPYWPAFAVALLAAMHLPVPLALAWFRYTGRDDKPLVRVQMALSVAEVVAAMWMLMMITAQLVHDVHGQWCLLE